MTTLRPAGIVPALLLLSMTLFQGAPAQGYDTPLTIQGLDRVTNHSAASRGAGGVTIDIRNDVALMFLNPASLQSLSGIQLSVGMVQQYLNASQVQEYGPLKYYTNFSLLMEGRTGEIPDPDSLGPNPNAGDSVQRPYDAIPPNWSRSSDRGLPLQALLAVPFSLGETKFVAGAGAVQYADLDHYYQNNNVLTPSILSERPLPTVRPPNDSLPTIAEWSQYLRERSGTLRGYGLALSGEIPGAGISLGISGMLLDGSTDDLEQRVARGRLTFYTNYFRLDSVYCRSSTAGTSTYKGTELTFSGIYRGKAVSLGFALKPPMTITREYLGETTVDSTGTPVTMSLYEQDEVRLPWRGTIGLALQVVPELSVGLEYELRSYASAVYTRGEGVETNPWLSASVVHAGVVYAAAPWLTLRGGVRGQGEVFEPEGNPIAGEAVTTTVYSAGCGLSYAGVRLNLTYEYAQLKYQDIWGSAISLNTEGHHAIVADLAYDIPWTW